MPPVPGDRDLPEMGDRDRTGRRRVGRYERGRATRSQAPPGPRPPRPLNTEPQSRTARELRKRLDTTGAQPLLLYTGRAQVARRRSSLGGFGVWALLGAAS